MSRQKAVAIMCAEAVPWRCHRSLVADALTIRDIPIIEILSESGYRVHKLTPFARRRNGNHLSGRSSFIAVVIYCGRAKRKANQTFAISITSNGSANQLPVAERQNASCKVKAAAYEEHKMNKMKFLVQLISSWS